MSAFGCECGVVGGYKTFDISERRNAPSLKSMNALAALLCESLTTNPLSSCQTFSQIGKQNGLNDDRGLLLFEMVRFAKDFLPKAILIENVKALTTAKNLQGVSGGELKIDI